jgi:hypothetical protein
MQALKAQAGNPSEFPRFSKQGADSKAMRDTEAMMMTAPIPGQSLTQNPESRLPYETPPKFNDVQDFIDETFLRFTDEDALPDLLDSLRMGLPVEHVAEKYLDKAFREGEITPDLLLLCIEPVIYMLISLATYAEIDPVLYPEDPMIDDEATPTHTDLYKRAVREMQRDPEDKGDDGKLTVTDLQAPANMPKSLLARSQQAVAKVKGA